LEAFCAVPDLAGVLVVVSPGDAFFQGQRGDFVVADCGGSTRAQSVLNGLQALRSHGAQDQDWVLVHDAARCLILPTQIQSLVAACRTDAVGGLLALRLPDTLKRARDGRVAETVDRSDKWLAQTPQMFRFGMLTDALRAAGDAVTDESSAMEAQGHQPRLVEGSAHNFKVTYPADFALADALLQSRAAPMQPPSPAYLPPTLGDAP
jgi:2-C-methyl-D-erythritol 4-phosphate cytidylyltransferase